MSESSSFLWDSLLAAKKRKDTLYGEMAYLYDVLSKLQQIAGKVQRVMEGEYVERW